MRERLSFPGRGRGRRGWEGRGTGALVVVGACLLIAVASLAVRAAIAYDPWAWLVWGREVRHLDLDTAGGPSWKPLPVLLTTPLAFFGGAAPALWLVVARTAALLAVVGVYRLAARFAGPVAGVLAAGFLVLSPDAGPRFVRLFLEGHSAPLTAALTVWAIERHLSGRPAAALVLGTLLALDRPEAWPFLALYGLWCWRHHGRLRPLLVGSAAVVAVLWFGGDWWGSGNPWHGATSARVLDDDSQRTVDALRRVGEVVIPPAWVAAAAAVVLGLRARNRTPAVLFAGAVAWFALVVVMSAALGYAALSRFLVPGAAVLCVLAGVGVVWLYEAVPRGAARVVFTVLVATAAVPLVVLRADGIPAQVDEVRARGREIDDLDAVIASAGGGDPLARCGRIGILDGGVARMAAAWELGVPLARVRIGTARVPGALITPDRPDPDRFAEGRSAAFGRPVDLVARSGAWDVYAVDCSELVRRAAP